MIFLKIKIETDTTPFAYASYETKFLLQPYPVPVRLYDRSSLFAGKLDAVLARNWHSRVKGRDLYDYLFYISNNCPVNLLHLESRLKKSGYISEDTVLTDVILHELLMKKFSTTDFNAAKTDVAPFIADIRMLDYWSAELFLSVTDVYFSRHSSEQN